MAAFDIRNLSFTYPNESKKALDGISLTIPEGGITLICGASGSGKSTLLRRLKPCISDFGSAEGEIFYFGEPISALDNARQAREIGFVFQHPDDQLVTDKVFHELAFGPESLGWEQNKMRLAVAEAASYFGLSELFMKDVSKLSGGQKQLLNLASACVTHPRALLLDEPASRLDPIAAANFLDALRRLSRDFGVTVIFSEQRLEDALPMADMLAVLDGGRLAAFGKPEKTALEAKSLGVFQSMPTTVRVYAALGGTNCAPLTVSEGRSFLKSRKVVSKLPEEQPRGRNESTAMKLLNCRFKYEKNAPDVLRSLSLTVRRGEVFALLGPNGAGKSTALGVMAGVLKPYAGKLIRNCGRVTALPQDPRELFVKDSVRAELAELTDDSEELENTAAFLELTGLMDRHPSDISGGEQQRLALGKALLTKPEALLLDEPTKGMDGEFKKSFGETLRRLSGGGMAVFIVSHDVEFCAEYADRCALLFNGEALAEGTPRDFFGGNFFYTTAAAKLARGIVDGAVRGEEILRCLE